MASGADAIVINPAGLKSPTGTEIFVEFGGLRNALDPRTSGSIIPFDQPLARFNSLGVSWRASQRIYLGCALSHPNQYRVRWELTETTYEYFVGAGTYIGRVDVGVWELTSAAAYRLSEELAVGGAVALHHHRVDSDFIEGKNILTYKARANALALRLGWLIEFPSFSCGFFARSGFDLDLSYRNPDGETAWQTTARLPVEFGVGLDWRKTISLEYSRIFVDGDKQDINVFGGGVRAAMARSREFGTLNAAIGLRYRVLPDNFLMNRPDQTFINCGLELAKDDYKVALTLINGHWLSNEAVRVSEVLLSLRRSFGA